MMRLFLALCITLVFSSPGWCELRLVTAEVNNGDVAVVRWDGERLSFGVLRFLEHVVYLYPDSNGYIALLPIGLDVSAGSYPVVAALVNLQGETTSRELQLKVTRKERPEERLTLPEKMVTPDKENLVRIQRESVRLNEMYALRSSRMWTDFEAPVAHPISSIFGKRRVMNGKPRAPHSGTDFRSPTGTPVGAISNGRVVLIDDLFYTGNTVVVDHGEGLISLYAHLSEVSVKEGHELLPGEILGLVGSTGRSTGAHLHLTVRLLGERVDPLSLLALFKK